jgi:hypothetical protein
VGLQLLCCSLFAAAIKFDSWFAAAAAGLKLDGRVNLTAHPSTWKFDIAQNLTPKHMFGLHKTKKIFLDLTDPM